MTVQECYAKLHGNYEEARLRFVTDEKIEKFLFMFLNDKHYEKLCEAMEAGDYEEAFLNVHTLKGVGGNLALTSLTEEAKVLTELLRDGKYSEEAKERLAGLEEVYVLTRKAIEELKDGE